MYNLLINYINSIFAFTKSLLINFYLFYNSMKRKQPKKQAQQAQQAQQTKRKSDEEPKVPERKFIISYYIHLILI